MHMSNMARLMAVNGTLSGWTTTKTCPMSFLKRDARVGGLDRESLEKAWTTLRARSAQEKASVKPVRQGD